MEKGEAAGAGIAVAGHAALLAALTLGFANASQPPLMAPPIEVSFVDEVGLESAVTQVSPEPPAQSVAPEVGPPEEAAPQPAETPVPPQPAPQPAPKAVEPTPQPKPAPKEAVKPAPAKPAPQPAAAKAAAKPAPAKSEPARTSESGQAKATTGSRLGSNFLKGIGSDPSPSKSEAPSGAVMSAQALSGIKAAIERQIQPCANRQVNPGPGANEIVVTLNIRLNRDGSLAGRPRVMGTKGVNDGNSRYEDRVKDLAIASYTGCSPLRGLPEDLYQTPQGGWSNLAMTYRLP